MPRAFPDARAFPDVVSQTNGSTSENATSFFPTSILKRIPCKKCKKVQVMQVPTEVDELSQGMYSVNLKLSTQNAIIS